MAWKNGYYYRNRREGDQVVSEYVGSGYAAELLAQLDEKERIKAKAKRELFRRQVTADRAQQNEIDATGKAAGDMVTALMLIAGYHRHKRQWRKDRDVEAIQVMAPADLDITAEHLNALITAVDGGKPTKAQRAELARYFEQLPGLAKLQGDAMAHITARLVKSLHGRAGGMAAGVHLANLKKELGYDEAPMIEQMLIEHILVCWARLQLVEWRNLNHTEGEHNMREGAYWEKALNAAQRRYLRACETLARVRRLNVKIQVNVANQQIVTG